MPNLVGIGNSQVPTNAMLGGMAYQESNNVVIDSLEPGNISKIITSLNAEGNSPRGVFIYNTANDSDCLLYTSPSPRDATLSRMQSSA